MTVGEIKERVMFQTNNDVDDVDDFEPHILEYINDAYDRLVYALEQVHLSGSYDDNAEESNYTQLVDNMEEPAVNWYYHPYIADWATWLVYRNGNPQKQNRGVPFRDSFEMIIRSIKEQGKNGQPAVKKYMNMPR